MTNVTVGVEAIEPSQLRPIPDFGKENWGKVLEERLDGGHGKRFKLMVEYSPAVDEYRWSVTSKIGEWVGFEKTMELAVDVACQVYGDYVKASGEGE